jgi:hypothetical protein
LGVKAAVQAAVVALVAADLQLFGRAQATPAQELGLLEPVAEGAKTQVKPEAHLMPVVLVVLTQ